MSTDTYRVKEDLGEVDNRNFTPGTVIEFPYRPRPYPKFVIFGTDITVRGLKGPNGEGPVLDGNGITTHPQYRLDNLAYDRGGLITVGPTWANRAAVPRNVTIEGFELRGVPYGATFTNWDGSTQRWDNGNPTQSGAAGVYYVKGDGLTIRDCLIHDCMNGVLTTDQITPCRNVLIEGCRIWGNGIEGQPYQHNTYVQCRGATYLNNWYGPLRPGSKGVGLRDRSSNVLVRGNRIEAGTILLNFDNWNNETKERMSDPNATRIDVFNNELINRTGAVTLYVLKRYTTDDGTLFGKPVKGARVRFQNNTVLFRYDRGEVWTTTYLFVNYDANVEASGEQLAEVVTGGNLVDIGTATAQGRPVQLVRCNGAGRFVFGKDWSNVPLIESQTTPDRRRVVSGVENLVVGGSSAGYGTDVAPPPVPPPPVPPVVPPPPPPDPDMTDHTIPILDLSTIVVGDTLTLTSSARTVKAEVTEVTGVSPPPPVVPPPPPPPVVPPVVPPPPPPPVVVRGPRKFVAEPLTQLTAFMEAFKAGKADWWTWNIEPIVVVAGEKPSLLLGSHNKGGCMKLFSQGENYQQWTDRTAAAGLIEDQMPHEQRPMVGDIDGTGRMSILSKLPTKVDQTKPIWRNNGDGTFSPINSHVGDMGRMSRFVVQNDGRLGVYQPSDKRKGKTYERWATNQGNCIFTFTEPPVGYISIPEDLPQNVKNALLEIETIGAPTNSPAAYENYGPVYWRGDLRGLGRRDCVIQLTGSYATGIRRNFILYQNDSGVLEDVTGICGIPWNVVPIFPADGSGLWDLDGDGRFEIITAYGSRKLTDPNPCGLYVQKTTPGVFEPARVPDVNNPNALTSKDISGFASTDMPYAPEMRRFDFGDVEPYVLFDTLRGCNLGIYKRANGGLEKVMSTPHCEGEGFCVVDLDGDGYLDIVTWGSPNKSNVTVTAWMNRPV